MSLAEKKDKLIKRFIKSLDSLSEKNSQFSIDNLEDKTLSVITPKGKIVFSEVGISVDSNSVKIEDSDYQDWFEGVFAYCEKKMAIDTLRSYFDILTETPPEEKKKADPLAPSSGAMALLNARESKSAPKENGSWDTEKSE